MKKIELFKVNGFAGRVVKVEVYRNPNGTLTSYTAPDSVSIPQIKNLRKMMVPNKRRHVIKFIKTVLGAKHKVYVNEKNGKTRFLGYSKVKVNTNDLEKTYNT